MRAIAFLRRNALEIVWVAFAAANFAAMTALPRWETIPFHFIWVSFTLLYGLRVFSRVHTALLLAAVCIASGAAILHDALAGTQPWDELSEVPLMSAMFLAMVWHARRRQEALSLAELQADRREATLAQQERLLHDVSHELRTPVTVARGQLEVLARTGTRHSEIDVALDELERIERILGRLLLLAQAEQPDFVVYDRIDVEAFLEDVFVRWSEVAARAWRLGSLATGTLEADSEGIRTILDSLLENAVKYTGEGDRIEVRSYSDGRDRIAIEVADTGRGVPAEAQAKIFDRFARADAARTRAHGGVGLGLAIVEAIARAHGGSCDFRPRRGGGSVFTVRLPQFRPAPAIAGGVPAPALGAP
jgi:two-component system OmpR family sensor kinase